MMPMDPNQNGPGMGRGPMQPQGGPGGQVRSRNSIVIFEIVEVPFKIP